MPDITGLHLGTKFKNLAKTPWRAIKGLTGVPNPSEIPGVIGGGVKKILGDNPGQIHQVPQYTPQQQQVMDLLLQLGGEKQQNPYEGFEGIEQNALNNFFEQIVPQLTEGFSGSGNNAYSSPVLQTNLSSAGSSLAQRLAAMQNEYGMQNQHSGLQQLQLGLNPRNENYFQAPTPGIGRGLLDFAASSLGPLSNLYQGQQSANALQQILRNR